MTSWKRIELMLLLNKLGNSPKPFNREQGGFCLTGISLASSCVISQTGSNGSMIAIGHANDEIGIRPSANSNELHALTVQGMMRVGDGDPFHRWFVKGGSVL